jgi:drug/metabolite transporter (DMT)-like permease
MTALTTPRPLADERALDLKKLTVALALVSVYLIWGSTYLGMRVALETFSPFVLGATRFLVAGGILLAWVRLRGAPWPTGAEWRGAAISGVLMCTLGNGLVAVAQEAHVDSGVAATVVATMPMWMALASAMFGERPTRRELVGLLFGFAGVAMLQGGGNLAAGGTAGLVIIGAPIAWALGSVISRRTAMPKGSMGAAAQMIAGGAAMAVVALARGESVPTSVDARGATALVYLALVGSLLGFTAYGYLLRSTRPAVATSYAYVNPIVALVLGAVMAGEPLDAGRALACAVIVAGVLVVMHRPRAA